MDRSPDAQIEHLLAELAGRMEQYVACMYELPRVGQRLKLDLLRIAGREHDEIEALHRRIGALLATHPPCAPASPLSGLIRYISSRQPNADVLIADCQVRVAALDDPAARTFAQQWLSRARRYSDAGRRAQTVACIANTLARLPP